MSLHSHPVALVVATYSVACLVVLATDRYALTRRTRERFAENLSLNRRVSEISARLLIIALVYAGFFSLYWRPIYSMQGTISFFVIFTAISRAKFAYIREPLIFSDLALVVDLFKHKEIFYATFLNVAFWGLSLTYIIGVTGLYIWFEPTVLHSQDAAFWVLVGIILAYGPWVLIFTAKLNPPLVYICNSLLQTVDARRNTLRFGAFSSIVLQFISWLGHRREKVVAEIKASLQHAFFDLAGHRDEDNSVLAPLLIVWQSESFIDLRHFGVDDLSLPHLDALRERASQWGRVTNVFEGGYTLRTEFAVLTGLQPEHAHADASYPYLRAEYYADVAWPKWFLSQGWSTHFIHPYDRTFFFRDKAMPLLGFQDMTMLDAFDHDPSRNGPYVSDRRLATRVIETIESSDQHQPSFIFVASMANHGPWEAGRVGTLTDPIDIYKELLRKADDALGYLSSFLEAQKRPVWLLFYGDHAPLLKSFADPFPDPRTDYIVVSLGTAKCSTARPTAPTEAAPWNLMRSLVDHSRFSWKTKT